MKYTDTPVWWRFTQCQNFQGRYEVGKPETALKCADAAGIDWKSSDVGQCAGIDGSGKGKEGTGLLRDSVEVTKALGIEYVADTIAHISTARRRLMRPIYRKSCTILINGKAVCVRDGSWKDCEVSSALF